MKKLPLFVFLIASHLGLGQSQNNFIKDAVMPAPTAASLGKYGDVPVSPFTGTVDISIPLYTLQQGPLKLPISLSYHSSGVKINESASWVGLGWSLNAGGVITRTVQGLPDDEGGHGYLYTTEVQSRDIQQIELLLADNEPDLFSYSVNGYSGKFTISKTGQCLQSKKSDVKVEALGISNNDLYFRITTPDGIRYLFQGVKELTKVWRNDFFLWQEYTSSWYLSSMSSYDQQHTISFSYTDETYGVNSIPACSQSQTVYNYSGYPSLNEWCGALPPLNVSDISGKRLSSISTSTTTVEFLAGTREDMENGHILNNTAGKLEQMEIWEGAFCKKFMFSYDYFADNPALGPFHKQLKLAQIQESSCNGAFTNPAYEFTYEGPIVNGKQFLPNRRSKAMDHWGFYNGAHNNDGLSLFSGRSVLDLTPVGGGITVLDGGADRESNETYMKYGALKKIKFPTGGETSFEFEANRANVIYPHPDLDIENLVNLENCTSPYATGTCCGTNEREQIVTFSQIQLDEAILTVDLYDITYFPETRYDPCHVQYSLYNIDYQLEVRRASDNFFIGSFSTNMYGSNDPNSPYPKEHHPAISFGDLEIFGQFQAGVAYIFKLIVTDGVGKFSIDHHKTQDPQKVVGGLRIKKIISTEGLQGGPPVETEYHYNLADGKSSGLLSTYPQYATYYCLQGFLLVLFYESHGVFPLNSFDGYHIGYTQVEERIKDNGKKVYEFFRETHSQLGFPAQYPIEPVPPTLLNGENKKISVYTQSGQKVAETLYCPDPASSNHIYLGVNAVRVRKLLGSSGDPSFWNPFGVGGGWVFAEYQLKQSFYRLESDTSWINGVTTATTYTYDGANRHTQPVAIAKTNSDGKTFHTVFSFPCDRPESIYQTMFNSYNLLTVIEQIQRNSNLWTISGQRTNFQLFNNYPYPSSFDRYEANLDANGNPVGGQWVQKGVINEYYTNGYPKKFTATGWLPETYEWENGMIKKRTFSGHSWEYTYHANTRLVHTIKDVDGQITTFKYDGLMRLDSTLARGGNVKTKYQYQYKDASNPRNFVRTNTTFTPVSGSNLTQQQTWQYLDGLGRPLQTVRWHHQPTRGANDQLFGYNDIATAQEYDAYGRVVKTYTPYQSAYEDGSYMPVTGGTPFALTQYENSPLSRVTSVTPPGGYATTTAYGANTAAITIPGTSVTYPASSLFETRTTDPDGRVSLAYKDKRDRLVLSRMLSGSANADTYYQYDGKDRLIRVIPPGATAASADLIYTYEYDAADRLVKKKVPGMGFQYMKYNTRDLLVFSRDSNLVTANQCLGYKYDDYGRMLESGLVAGFPADPNTTFSFAESQIKNYYDGYDGSTQLSLTTFPQYRGRVRRTQSRVLGSTGGGTWLHTTFTYDVYGRTTQTQGNNYLNTASATAETVANTYDYADFLITSTRTHLPGAAAGTGNQTLKTDYWNDHTGRKTGVLLQHNGGATTHLAEYNYDYRERLIERNLHSGLYGSTWGWLQSVDYAYNDQDWLTAINTKNATGSSLALGATCSPSMPNPGSTPLVKHPEDNDLFYLELRYDQLFTTSSATGGTISGLSGTLQKGGNIAQMAWRVRGRERQAYTFTYDTLSRLKTASYFDVNTSGTATASSRFNEALTYDLRGNIATLQRQGFIQSACNFGQIDNLAYTYASATNRLTSVADASGKTEGFKPGSGAGYTYDGNGNLKSDSYKSISSITYNHLNLPKLITFSTGNTIEIVYDAAGNKLRKIVKQGATVQYEQDYSGGIEYRKTPAAGTFRIEAIYHEEGRYFNLNVDASNTPSWRKEYALRDHLGNTRLMFADKDGDGIVEVTSSAATNEILQELHYYPFGLSYGGTHWMNDAARDNGHKYNGKELNEDWGLGWYDYGARWYMPDLGRWGAVDPLAVKSRHISVYGYANNSPFMFIDPTGEENMIYLVFILNDKVRLSSSHINEIVRIAQRIMDKSGANVKISQVIRNAPYTEEELALRDETDRTVFISDYYTLRKHFPNLKPEPGEADPEMKLGGVDASFFLQGYAAPEGGDKRLEEYYEDQVGSLINGNVGDALAWIAKTAIHEAFHTLPGGPGHSNEQNALRYGSAGGGLSVPVAGDNLMMQHQTGSSLERFPRENRPLLFSFLWQDRRILHEYYNKQTPKDNFTERLKK